MFKQFSHLVSLFAAIIQRGFVEGRQLVLNIADLDAICRAQANLNLFPFESILALWDFKAAFPSISHEWIRLVFKKYGFPNWFLCFLEALLFHNFAIFSQGGFKAFLYLILSGIVQGCPSAGMLFAVAADPFFTELYRLQGKVSTPDLSSSHIAFRGCADDIGGALGSYKLLKLAKPNFDHASLYAGLTLNPQKCIIIPTCFDDFEKCRCAIQAWLEVNIPEWQTFQILGRHPYLGPDLGPEAGEELWDKAISKYWERVLRISGLGPLYLFFHFGL